MVTNSIGHFRGPYKWYNRRKNLEFDGILSLVVQMCAYMKTTRLSMAKLPTKLSLKVEQRSKIGKLLKQQGAASGFYSYAILENMVDSR